MPDDERFNNLEERLCDEAGGLLGAVPSTPLIADLRHTFVRRRRRRQVAQSVSATAVLLFGLAGWRWLHPQVDEDRTIPVPTAGVHEPMNSKTPEARAPRDAVVVEATRDARTLRPGSLAIGVWVARPRPDGKTELVPGLYVPEQAEPIDSQNWSPTERLAVSRLLGPEANRSRQKTI